MGDASALRSRCFVGLWPDAAAAARLGVISSELLREFPRARRVAQDKLHLTLAFIGDLEADRAGRLTARVRELDAVPFTWLLDRIGSFDGARVAWAGGAAPTALVALVDAVRELLKDERVPFDRRPYQPHVTLLRHLPRTAAGLARPLSPPIEWTGHVPVLLQSADGRYVEVAVVN